MRYLLLFPLLALGLTASSQIPDYVPSDGLVAWYGFANNGLEGTGNAPEMLLVGNATFTTDRSGIENNALDPNGGSANTDGPFFDYGWGDAFSLSMWFTRPLNTGGNARLISTECPEGNFRIANDAAGQGIIAQMGSYMYLNPLSDEWHQVVYTYDGDATKRVYLDGALYAEEVESGFEPQNFCNPLALGRKASSSGSDLWPGDIDDVGIWDRCLGEEEILGLYLSEVLVYGCTNEDACNYDPEANVDDGSCLELDACGECGGEGVAGCTAPEACNYNPIASCDDGGCVYPLAIDLGVDIETCDESVTLDAGPGFENYLWTTGDTSQAIQVHEPGEYGVLGTLQLEQDALLFDGENDFVVTPANPSFNFESSLSFGVWVKVPPGNSGWNTVLGGYYDHGVNIYAGSGNSNGAVRVELPGVHTLTSNTDLRDNQWHHVMVIYDGSALSIWIDGQIEISEEASGNINPDNDGEGYDLYLGRGNHTGEYFTGAMAFPELWNIALSPESIQAHFQCPPSEENNGLVALWQFDENNGALAPDASGTGSDGQIFGAVYSSDVPSGLCSTQCHTSASDTINVQLFTYSCLCGEGAVWDEILGECVGEISPENACHDGTIWSETVGACVVANPSDTDFDGCVSMTDLLDLLSVFGTCAEEDPAVMEWLCGDPLEYHGYEYETVQIGEQCWFAENLRAESYQNGDFITSGMSNEEWSSATSGATAVYGDDPSNLDAFGRLYNFYVVEDNRLICPAMWHVPSDEEVIELENHLGMMPDEASAVGFRGGNIGDALKSTSGWNGDGNGTNVSGLNVVPSGNRYHHGAFLSLGENGSWWTSTQNQNDESRAWYRSLSHDDEGIYREQDALKTIGFPIRCIKNAE